MLMLCVLLGFASTIASQFIQNPFRKATDMNDVFDAMVVRTAPFTNDDERHLAAAGLSLTDTARAAWLVNTISYVNADLHIIGLVPASSQLKQQGTLSAWMRRPYRGSLTSTASTDPVFTANFAAGFPMRAMRMYSESRTPSGASHWKGAITLPNGDAHPILPIWPGLLADIAFWGFAWWLLFAAFFTTKRTITRRRRLARNRCPNCAYDLHNQPTPGCPECGWLRAAGTTSTQ